LQTVRLRLRVARTVLLRAHETDYCDDRFLRLLERARVEHRLEARQPVNLRRPAAGVRARGGRKRAADDQRERPGRDSGAVQPQLRPYSADVTSGVARCIGRFDDGNGGGLGVLAFSVP